MVAITIIISVACILLLATSAYGATDVGFRISPTSINSTIAVGDETNETVTLKNFSTDEIVVNVHAGADVTPAEPIISLEPDQVSLKPGESGKVVVRVKVPDDAQPGQWQSSVFFDAGSSAERDVSIVGQVGVVLSIEVIRPVTDVSWSFPRIIDSTDKVVFRMEGRNSGNFTTKLEGDARLAGIVRGDVDLQAASGPIAVGESASLQAVWDETPLFAIKKVTLDLSSGIGAPVEQKAFLVIFPWKLTLMLVLIAAIAATGAGFQSKLAKVFSGKGRREDL
jgi:hypothetical protein